jgi:hypothetical protein
VGEQETETDETVDDGWFDCMETDVFEETVGLCTLVAVMVTLPPESGAVKRPFAVMAPVLADHLTAEL